MKTIIKSILVLLLSTVAVFHVICSTKFLFYYSYFPGNIIEYKVIVMTSFTIGLFMMVVYLTEKYEESH
jgi:hypothetical protein